MHKAILFEKLADKKVKCKACRHYCTIPPDRFGICGVRANADGVLDLLVYGLPSKSAVGVDPVEKKPLFHFLPGTEIFSIGTIGCNFACAFCQNWDLSQASKNTADVKELINKTSHDLPPEKIVEYSVEHKLPSIAYTYNEPSIFFEYSFDTAKLAKKHGIKNVYVSNGYASVEAIDMIAPYLDAVNIDLKSFSDKFYREVCRARLQPVLDNIVYYNKKKIWVEITTLVIPGKNDSKKELKAVASFLASVSKDIPWHISKFTPQYKMLDTKPTPDAVLREAHELGKEAGLRYVYTGNVFDSATQSTYCYSCNELLVERDWGYVRINNFKNGVCPNCNCKIAGIWA